MVQFAAIKIHYDHRKTLPRHLKYSVLPTQSEYEEYLQLYRDKGIGGNGFHECLNFSIPQQDPVRIYLPPTSLPSTKKLTDEFLIFSFTYKDDQSLSANVIGVHAGVRILSNEPGGVARPKEQEIAGIEPLHYHGEAPSDLVTLFTPPLPYDFRDGIYTPTYERWGFGRRYINAQHAVAIISDAYQKAAEELAQADLAKQTVIRRQLEVLARINSRYNLGASINIDANKKTSTPPTNLPDKEIGYLGERYVYEREVNYAIEKEHNSKEVEWISQSVPNAPFDIKSIRIEDNIAREHFIEVKSSTSMDEDGNIYVSSQQFEFAKSNKQKFSFALVSFDKNKRFLGISYLNLDELLETYESTPIKYKLTKKTPTQSD